MSERGQGQGQGQAGQADQQGKTYVVKTSFTDDKGKQWQAGQPFSGDSEAVRKAIAAGQIEEGQGQPRA